MASWRPLAGATAPVFAADALRQTGARSGNSILGVIRAGSYAGRAPAFAPAALLRTFGCGEPSHAFDNAPHSWAWFREPQIIAGLAHFLQAGPACSRVERVRAFLTAAYECAGAGGLVRRIEEADILSAETVAEESRVDLIVQAFTSEHEHLGLVVEAKFDHHLTPRQLPAARRHAAGRGLGPDNAAFLVVLPHRADTGSRILPRPANSGWRAVSWWALLAALERRLKSDVDSEAFRSFRHTIWQQTYG